MIIKNLESDYILELAKKAKENYLKYCELKCEKIIEDLVEEYNKPKWYHKLFKAKHWTAEKVKEYLNKDFSTWNWSYYTHSTPKTNSVYEKFDDIVKSSSATKYTLEMPVETHALLLKWANMY